MRGTRVGSALLAAVLLLSGCGGSSGGGGGSTTASATGVVTMAWDRNSESDLAGYRVYRATVPGGYGAPIASLSPAATSYQAASLQKGSSYYFSVTAYDTAGNESPLYNEIQVNP